MKTVKLRIAVAVDPEGDWHAVGWKGISQIDYDTMMEEASEDLDHGELQYWITAEVEVPEAVEVAGSIEEDQ